MRANSVEDAHLAPILLSREGQNLRGTLRTAVVTGRMVCYGSKRESCKSVRILYTPRPTLLQQLFNAA